MPDQIYYKKRNVTTGKDILAKINADVAAMFGDSASITWSYDTGTGVLTGTAVASGVDVAALAAVLVGVNGISTAIDYDGPDHIHITFENYPGEGIVLFTDQVYLDDEVVREDMRGMDDEYQEFTFEKLSVDNSDCIATDIVETNPNYADIHQYDRHEHFLIHGDPNYYFVVRLEAEWSKTNTDNDANIDFSTNNIWAQFVTRPRSTYTTDVSLWTKSFSKECAYVSGSSILIDESFIFEADVPTYVGFNLSDEDGMLMDDIIKPIANFSLFWKRITVTRKLKTNWFHRFALVPSDLDGVSLKSQQIPNGTGEGLPFNGYYDCEISCKVKEEGTVALDPANCGTMQTLEVQGAGDSKIQVARSGINIMVPPDNVDKWMNRHLGGAAIVYVSDADIVDRRVLIEVNLPNGSNKQLVGGYIHLKYRGANEGMIRI